MADEISSEFQPEDIHHKLGFKEFFTSTLTLLQLKKTRPDDIIFKHSVALVGLVAAYPRHLNLNTLNQNPRLRTYTAAIFLGTAVNDFVDMGPSIKRQATESASLPSENSVYREILNEWKSTLTGIGYKEGSDPETDSILASYMRGIIRLNNLAAQIPVWNLDTVINFKELENAISLVHTSAILLGTSSFPPDCFNLSAKLNWPDFEKRFAWLIKGQPENEIQTNMCSLYYLTMATQTIDDTFDQSDDTKLGLHTLFTEALHETEGDVTQAKDKMTALAENYYLKGKKFGLTKVGYTGVTSVMSIFKSLMHTFPGKIGGRRERLLAHLQV